MNNDLPNLTGIGPLNTDEAPQLNLPKSEPKKKKKAVSTRKSPACKLLNAKLYKYKRDKAINPAIVVEPKHHENSASAVEKCIIAYCSMMPNGYAFKVGGKGTPRKVKGKTIMTASGDTNGISDVCAIIRGVFLGIEVKFSKGDKQRPAQVRFEKNVKRAKGHYIIVKNFTHFLQAFKNWYGENQSQMI